MSSFREDTIRVANLALKDGTVFEIDEWDWPPSTHGDDRRACEKWVELTGLSVTIRTKHLTSMDPPS